MPATRIHRRNGIRYCYTDQGQLPIIAGAGLPDAKEIEKAAIKEEKEVVKAEVKIQAKEDKVKEKLREQKYLALDVIYQQLREMK